MKRNDNEKQSPPSTPGADRLERLARLADIGCHGHVLALGGGGYDRRNLARAWCGVVEGLLNTPDTSG